MLPSKMNPAADISTLWTQNNAVDRAQSIGIGQRDRLIALAQSTSAISMSAVFAKDTGIGDIAFDVGDATVWYKIVYIARAATDVNATTIDFRIYDGGTSSPTNASTIIAAASIYLPVAGGAGQSQLILEQHVQLAVGTHTIAAFFGKITGSGNAAVANSTGQARELSVTIRNGI